MNKLLIYYISFTNAMKPFENKLENIQEYKVNKKSWKIIEELNSILYYIYFKYNFDNEHLDHLPLLLYSSKDFELLEGERNNLIKDRINLLKKKYRKCSKIEKINQIKNEEHHHLSMIQKNLYNKTLDLIKDFINEYKENYQKYISNEIVNNEFNIENLQNNLIGEETLIINLIKNSFYILHYLIHSFFSINFKYDINFINNRNKNIFEKINLFSKKIQNSHIPLLKDKFVAYVKKIEEKDINKEILTEKEKYYLNIYKKEKEEFNIFYSEKQNNLINLYNNIKLNLNKLLEIVEITNTNKIITDKNINSFDFLKNINKIICYKLEANNKPDEFEILEDFISITLKQIDFLKEYEFNNFSEFFIKYYNNNVGMIQGKIELDKIELYNDFNLNYMLLLSLYHNIFHNIHTIEEYINENKNNIINEIKDLDKNINNQINQIEKLINTYDKDHNLMLIKYKDIKNKEIKYNKELHPQFNEKSIYEGY